MGRRNGSPVNDALGLILRAVLEKRPRLAGYVTVGTLYYASAIGLMATSVYLVTRASLKPAILTLGILIAGTRYFAISRSLSRYLERLLSHSLVIGTLVSLRIAVFRALIPLFPQNASTLSSGEALGKISRSIEDAESLLLRVVAPAVLLLGTAVLVLIVGFYIEPSAGLLVFLLMVAFALSTAFAVAGFGIDKASRDYESRVAFEKDGSDLLRGSEELFLMGVLRSKLENLQEISEEMEENNKGRLRRNSNRTGMAGLTAQFAFVATTFLSLRAATAGDLGVLAVAVMPMVAQASFEAVQTVAMGASAAPWYLRSVRELPVGSTMEPELKSEHYGIAPGIRFSDVVLSPSEVSVLGPFRFQITPGSRCAIVGESGSGKTSIAYAMLGYIQPEFGAVSFFGSDSWCGSLRPDIGYMPENPAVLESSLRSNLAIADPNAGDDEMVSALRSVSLDYLAARHGGLDQVLGAFGTELSGGERQRLALARLVLADFSAVVLDEPTASLDRATAVEVMTSVFQAFLGKTVVVITHDRELLELFDQVIEIC